MIHPTWKHQLPLKCSLLIQSNHRPRAHSIASVVTTKTMKCSVCWPRKKENVTISISFSLGNITASGIHFCYRAICVRHPRFVFWSPLLFQILNLIYALQTSLLCSLSLSVSLSLSLSVSVYFPFSEEQHQRVRSGAPCSINIFMNLMVLACTLQQLCNRRLQIRSIEALESYFMQLIVR